MKISLFFNLSFDLALIALIIFIIWIIFQKIKPKSTKSNHNLHHWLSAIIVLLILSIMSLSYGGLQLTKGNINLPTQNSTKINLLRQEIINLKRKSLSQGKKKSKSKLHLSRTPTMTTNKQIKKALNKHQVKIKLRVQIKSINAKKHTFLAQNQRQMYKITQFKNQRIKPKQSIIIKGTATKNNHNIIILKDVNLVH